MPRYYGRTTEVGGTGFEKVDAGHSILASPPANGNSNGKSQVKLVSSSFTKNPFDPNGQQESLVIADDSMSWDSNGVTKTPAETPYGNSFSSPDEMSDETLNGNGNGMTEDPALAIIPQVPPEIIAEECAWSQSEAEAHMIQMASDEAAVKKKHMWNLFFALAAGFAAGRFVKF